MGSHGQVGPFFIHRADDDTVVGEIGGAFVEDTTIEIGYAVVRSCWNRGYATAEVAALVTLARRAPASIGSSRTPGSSRPRAVAWLEKTGFALLGEAEDQHDGATVRVKRCELAV